MVKTFGVDVTCKTCNHNTGNNMFNVDPFHMCSLKLHQANDNVDNREWDVLKHDLDINNCVVCDKYHPSDKFIPTMIYINNIEDLIDIHLSYINKEYSRYRFHSISNRDDEACMLEYLGEPDEFYDDNGNYSGDGEQLKRTFKNKLEEQYPNLPAVAFIYCNKDDIARNKSEIDFFYIEALSSMINYKE